MDSGFVELVAKFGLLPALFLFAVSILLPRLLAARTEMAGESARTDVIESLSARVSALEADLNRYRSELEEERRRRIAAEDSVAVLTRRVASLEAQIRSMGHEPQ